MTAPTRMTPEREAELRAVLGDDSGGRVVHNRPIITELLDALAAERAHAQQVEVPHSSAAVLGYVVVERFVAGGPLVVWGTGPGSRDPYPLVEGARDNLDQGCASSDVAAVVRVGADGRIGS